MRWSAFPWSGGQSNPLGTMRRWFLRRWGGLKTPRLLRRKSSIFALTKRFPADTSGADWPYPQTNNRILSGERSAYGHLDKDSIMKFPADARIIAPLGVKKLFQ